MFVCVCKYTELLYKTTLHFCNEAPEFHSSKLGREEIHVKIRRILFKIIEHGGAPGSPEALKIMCKICFNDGHFS